MKFVLGGIACAFVLSLGLSQYCPISLLGVNLFDIGAVLSILLMCIKSSEDCPAIILFFLFCVSGIGWLIFLPFGLFTHENH